MFLHYFRCFFTPLPPPVPPPLPPPLPLPLSSRPPLLPSSITFPPFEKKFPVPFFSFPLLLVTILSLSGPPRGLVLVSFFVMGTVVIYEYEIRVLIHHGITIFYTLIHLHLYFCISILIKKKFYQLVQNNTA